MQVVSGPDLSLNKHGGRRGIPSSTGELASILEQYRDLSLSTAQKRAQSKGAIHVLSTMENSSVQLGDWSGYGQRGNAGNLRHLLGLMSKEVAAMRHTLLLYVPRGAIALMADTGDLRARGTNMRTDTLGC